MNKDSDNTTWRFYTTNDAGWNAMLEACEAAKTSIDLEQFIFITNEIGRKFIDVCIKKAKEGVRVRFLWDAAGSFSFYGSSIAEELKKNNIELIFFQTLFPSILKVHNYKSWYFRNHKRALIVDSKIGFTGSICVSDEMINWRDTVVKIEGEVVNEMEMGFERMWRRAQGKKLGIVRNEPSHGEFRYISNYPIPNKRHLYSEIIDAIRNAKEHIYITTPYFVPTRHLSRVLRAASKRGVDIKIIVPESSDHPIVDLCSRSFFTQILKSGIKIFLHKGEMIHNKTVIIDDTWSTIGTLNLDTASLLYNFEANIVSRNILFSKELSVHFVQDLLNSEEVTLEQWQNRYRFEKIAGFFARFLRDFM